jgi:small basic protein
MVIADAFGIVVGIVMRKHIPGKIIKWVSAVIFILFGLIGIYGSVAARFPVTYTRGFIILISACAAYAAYRLGRPKKR